MKQKSWFLMLLMTTSGIAIVAFHQASIFRGEVIRLREVMKDRDAIEAENIMLRVWQTKAESAQAELALLRQEAKDVLRLRAKVTALSGLLERKAEISAYCLELSNKVQELTSLNGQLQANIQTSQKLPLRSGSATDDEE